MSESFSLPRSAGRMKFCSAFTLKLRESFVDNAGCAVVKSRQWHLGRVHNELIKRRLFRSSIRPRATSLALLLVFAHAMFVCVTHHHSSARSLSSTGVIVTADANDESGAAPDSKGDGHCLSCRLQRNFPSNIHTSSLVVQQLEGPANWDTLVSETCPAGCSLLLSGRSPPLAHS